MLDLTPIAARLRVLTTPAYGAVLGHVETSLNLKNLAEQRMPAVSIAPSEDTADAAQWRPKILTSGLSVVIVVRNLSDGKGAAALRDLAPARFAVYQALQNWQPTGCIDPINYLGGRLLHVADTAIYWQDDYRTKQALTPPAWPEPQPLPLA